MTDILLQIDNLSIAFGEQKPVVANFNIEVKRGECVAIVGQSGSGKTLTALSVPQLLPTGACISDKSRIIFEDQDLLLLPERKMQQLRGGHIGMIFQDAMAAFNPVKTIGEQLDEIRRLHNKQTKQTRLDASLESLAAVGIHDPERLYFSYPHQLSGGMRQRAMIALALSHNPKLLIADEPTTALDVTIQKQVLDLLKELQTTWGFSILFISHDLSVVAQVADHVAVLKDGICVEQAVAEDFFAEPKNQYSLDLRAAVLPLEPETLNIEETTNAVLTVNNLSVNFQQARRGWRRPPDLHAVRDAEIRISQGETLALVGESGSGKTTLAKALVNLVQPKTGYIKLYQETTKSNSAQMIFQDPYSAFNPRRSIGDSLLEAIHQQQPQLTRRQSLTEMHKLLEQVQINTNRCWSYPHEFSGGERQRIAIARALCGNPPLLILDEPTSALDVSIQLQILDLLIDLQNEHQIAYLLITHHMGIVAKMAHHMAVMQHGKIVEYGITKEILTNPQHSYTQTLLSAVLEMPETKSEKIK